MIVPAAAPLPDLIGRYKIERILGRGAMGVIYQALDPVIDRRVAIKLIRSSLIGGEERDDYLERFQREARAAGRCMHPNIVAIYDFALHQGDPYLAMEFVDGVSLAEVLRERGRFAAGDAVAVILQVLDALDCAHAAGVVHRDVKPANVMLLAGNRVKMTDFGIARFGGSDLTQHGTTIGSPSYMSPEQCRGEEVDARSDLFSTGTVLYEMLSGERAFPGPDLTGAMYRLLNGTPPRIAGLETALTAVLWRALAKAPDLRYASAQDMAAALRSMQRADSCASATMVSPPTQSRIAPAEVERAERALAAYLGPMAKILVRRALPGAGSVSILWDRLAAHIGEEPGRSVFLRQRDG